MEFIKDHNAPIVCFPPLKNALSLMMTSQTEIEKAIFSKKHKLEEGCL